MRRHIPAALALLAPLMLLTMIAILVWAPIADSVTRDLLNVALGAVISLCNQVYGFWFGSSHGSREKDSALLGLAERQESEKGQS